MPVNGNHETLAISMFHKEISKRRRKEYESPRPRELVFEMMRDGLLHYNCNSSFIVFCRHFISLCVISTPGSDNGNRQFLLFSQLQLVTWAHLFSVMRAFRYSLQLFNIQFPCRFAPLRRQRADADVIYFILWFMRRLQHVSKYGLEVGHWPYGHGLLFAPIMHVARHFVCFPEISRILWSQEISMVKCIFMRKFFYSIWL